MSDETMTGRLATGQVIARSYRVVRPMAKGGMGAVYEVVQLATGAHRALKVMHHRLARDPEFRARFEQEARVSASIRSDHVVEVIDAGVDESSGLLFIVMELLEGVTLGDEMAGRPFFAWPEVLEIFRQLGHALSRAHAVGIVHLDLKPANIFLARARMAGATYIVKVLDFGIARFASAPSGMGGGIGTPGWMAPEQVERDGAITPSADVWALGLIAFYLATGQSYWLPSSRASTAEAMHEIELEEGVPASERARQLGVEDRLFDGFDAWFSRCTRRTPSARFATASDAVEALERALAPTLAAAAPVALVASAHHPELESFRPPPADPAHAPTALPDRAPAAASPGTGPGSAVDATMPAASSVVPAPGATRRSAVTASTAPPAATPAPTGPRRSLRAAGGLVAAALVAVTAIFALRGSAKSPATSIASSTASATAPAQPASPPKPPLLRIHGANTLGADLVPSLAQAFLKKRTGARSVVIRHTAEGELLLEARDDASAPPPLETIEVFAHTASSAFADLGKGTADIGMASRRITRDEADALSSLGPLSSAASEQVIALDGVAVVVNPDNPVATLQAAQLASLLDGESPDWASVGGRAGPVHVVLPAEGLGTWDFVSGLVLGSKPLAPSALREESAAKLSDAVAADRGGIGLVGQGFVRKAKVVAMQEGTRNPLVPTAASVGTEDYMLTRRLYLYTPASAPAAARAFLDFATSDEAQPLVTAAGFVSLAPTCDPKGAACPGCTGAYRAAVAGACRVTLDFRYDPRSGELDARALRDLDRLARLAGSPAHSAKSVLLFAFAPGDAKTAATQSQADADSVALQLRARSLSVTVARGMGVQSPVPAATEEEATRRNRRVEVWLR